MAETKHDDGGPAFPQSLAATPEGDIYSSSDKGEPGASLWCYYAAHTPEPGVFQTIVLDLLSKGTEHDAVAQHKARRADAMIAEYRKRWPEESK
jgi:hypothetical protein